LERQAHKRKGLAENKNRLIGGWFVPLAKHPERARGFENHPMKGDSNGEIKKRHR
jgi:hypothetical protein